MDSARQLEVLGQLGQLLLAPRPLPRRLRDVLRELHAALPYVAARAIVLADGAPWRLEVAPDGERAGYHWPREHTARVLHTRAPLLHRIEPKLHYAAWPICWQGRVFGALEFLVRDPSDIAVVAPIMLAIAPFLATALGLSGTPDGAAAELSAEDQRRLDAIAIELETPTLLQPLLVLLLDTALKRSAAGGGSIHLAEANGHGLHLLSFEAPSASNGHALPAGAMALLPSSRTHELAKIALANGRAMIRQHGGETHFAAPIVHGGKLLGALSLEGRLLDREALLFVQRLAALAGPAVLRAQFFQQLADARTHLQQVFDQLPTGLAVTDSNGVLLRANPAWWQLWGIEPDEYVKLVPWDILPRILHRLGDPLAFSDLFTNANGSTRAAALALQNPWQELRIMFIPVRDSLAMQSGFLLALDDMTREREVDRLKSEFVSVVSHELRTPLTSILGYTELLLAREFDPSERREFIQTVYKEADHLSSLVEDLLNVSRLDAGKIKLERWVIALPKLVRELVAQLNAELDVERHRVLLDVPDALPPIFADRDRVRQILTNLLSNAIKYSPEGGEVVLHAAVLRHSSGRDGHLPALSFPGMAPVVPLPASAPILPPDPALLISVRDRGIGIPAHELPRIFERFYRVDNSNTRRIGGTGLGLAITRALVELHGGRIWADSVPGEGSTFWVTLPLATEVMRTHSRAASKHE